MAAAGEIFRDAQLRIALCASKTGEQAGTTATIVVITEDNVMFAYVGDSRACVVKADGSGAFPDTSLC